MSEETTKKIDTVEVPEQILENCINEIGRSDDVLKMICDIALSGDGVDRCIALAEMVRISNSRIEMTLAELIGLNASIPRDIDLSYDGH